MTQRMNPHLEQFARQLQIWAIEIIENGRTPFRRVDCCAEIDTDAGLLTPPLIFWINRQSMMAGGVILIPEKDLAAELNRGRSCAVALGLSHFVTWETAQVRLWKIEAERVTEQQNFPLPGTDHPEFFRHLLKEVVDALKVPAVTGAVPQQKLSIHYFINLFSTALQLALPSLTDAFRSQRAADPAGAGADVDQIAIEANRLLLLQILTAFRHNLFPDTLLPEQLGNIVEKSLCRAPVPIHTNLCHTWDGAPATLPLETAVCYHHLLLRLHQLRWKCPEDRMRLSLQHLLSLWYPDRAQQVAETAETLIHPDRPVIGTVVRLVLSDSPLLLASTTIARELASLDQPLAVYGSIFQLEPAMLPVGRLFARLLNQALITRTERALYSARLRVAWPHRSFKIRTDQSRWQWELIHLLGICTQEQSLRLELPATTLNIEPDDPFWCVLTEHYRVFELSVTAHETVLISLVREPQYDHPIRIRQRDQSILEVSASADPACLRSRLVSALQLPDTAKPAPIAENKTAVQPAKNLKQEICDQLSAYGIPNFPDQYLYFLEHPEMVSYRFTPPLQEGSRLLGQFELKDADNLIIQGYGDELEQALLVCARIGKGNVDLPRDRHQLAAILQRYRKDLTALHRHLSDLSYRHQEKPQAARNLIRSIWKKLELPDPEWFKN